MTCDHQDLLSAASFYRTKRAENFEMNFEVVNSLKELQQLGQSNENAEEIFRVRAIMKSDFQSVFLAVVDGGHCPHMFYSKD